mmetsp:Transcript_69973/g.116208  ORF Transcript_69973/g.116208 Transcript_69973/m.116208 type:complete len:437 (+) Transcript_69973:119-1429(+)
MLRRRSHKSSDGTHTVDFPHETAVKLGSASTNSSTTSTPGGQAPLQRIPSLRRRSVGAPWETPPNGWPGATPTGSPLCKPPPGQPPELLSSFRKPPPGQPPDLLNSGDDLDTSAGLDTSTPSADEYSTLTGLSGWYDGKNFQPETPSEAAVGRTSLGNVTASPINWPHDEPVGMTARESLPNDCAVSREAEATADDSQSCRAVCGCSVAANCGNSTKVSDGGSTAGGVGESNEGRGGESGGASGLNAGCDGCAATLDGSGCKGNPGGTRTDSVSASPPSWEEPARPEASPRPRSGALFQSPVRSTSACAVSEKLSRAISGSGNSVNRSAGMLKKPPPGLPPDAISSGSGKSCDAAEASMWVERRATIRRQLFGTSSRPRAQYSLATPTLSVEASENNPEGTAHSARVAPSNDGEQPEKARPGSAPPNFGRMWRLIV